MDVSILSQKLTPKISTVAVQTRKPISTHSHAYIYEETGIAGDSERAINTGYFGVYCVSVVCTSAKKKYIIFFS